MVGRRISRDRSRRSSTRPSTPTCPPTSSGSAGPACPRAASPPPKPAWIETVERRPAARLDGGRRHPRHRRRAALPALHRRPARPPVARVPRGQGARAAGRAPRRRRATTWCSTTPSIDPDLAVDVLHLVAPDIEVEVRRPIVLEHSNSSVVFDERTILKVLRKVEPGPNPDVEIPRVLAERGVRARAAADRRAPPRRHGPRRAPRLPRGRHRGMAARAGVGARRAGVAPRARGERR